MPQVPIGVQEHCRLNGAALGSCSHPPRRPSPVTGERATFAFLTSVTYLHKADTDVTPHGAHPEVTERQRRDAAALSKAEPPPENTREPGHWRHQGITLPTTGLAPRFAQSFLLFSAAFSVRKGSAELSRMSYWQSSLGRSEVRRV